MECTGFGQEGPTVLTLPLKSRKLFVEGRGGPGGGGLETSKVPIHYIRIDNGQQFDENSDDEQIIV